MPKREFVIDDDTIDVDSTLNGETVSALAGAVSVSLQPVGPGMFVVSADGKHRMVAVARHKSIFYVDIDSVLIEVREPSEDGFSGSAGDHGAAKDRIVAPMPGKIVKIMVAIGDAVELKQPLLIVEAMKMENLVVAKARGRVRAVNFSAGDQVDTEKPIIELDLTE